MKVAKEVSERQLTVEVIAEHRSAVPVVSETALATFKPSYTSVPPVQSYLSSLAKSGQHTMRTGLDRVASILTHGKMDSASFPWHELRFEHMQAVRAKLAEEDLSPNTVNTWLYAVKGVLRAAWNMSLMTAEEFHKAVSIKPIKGSRNLAGREIKSSEMGKLFRTCDKTPLGRRDAAILAVLFGCGFRRNEIVNLDLKDWDGTTFTSVGKGNHERRVEMPLAMLEILREWLQIRGKAEGPVFTPLAKIGRLTPDAIYSMLKTRCAAAGVAKLSPHDFRRTAITQMLKHTDINIVRQWVGHANIATTARYDRRGAEAVHEAVGRIKDPREE